MTLNFSSVLETKTSGAGRLTYKPNGYWDRTGEKMMLNVAESGLPVFRGTSPFGKRILPKQESRKSFHTLRCGTSTSSAVFFRTQCMPPVSSVFTEQLDFWSNNRCEQATKFGA